jgi:integrase
VIFKRTENGSYFFEFIFEGKRVRKCTHQKNRRAAAAIEAAMRTQLSKNGVGIAEKKVAPKFADYCDEWLVRYAKSKLKFSTWLNYKSVIERHLKPFFKSKRIDEITLDDLKKLISAKEHVGLKRGTIRNITAPLRAMLNHAIDDEKLASNPVNRVGRFLPHNKSKKQRFEIHPLTKAEARVLVEAASKFDHQTGVLALTALRTGVRMGELLALQWGDIDFDDRFIEIRRNLVLGKIGTPKSGHLRRIDLSTQLGAALKDLKRSRTEACFQAGVEMPKWVFVNDRGQPLEQSNFRKRNFHRVLDAAGMPHMRWHDLRHTFASLLLRQGESLTYVKDQLGHASIQMTVDVYGHLVPGDNLQAVDRLDDSNAVNL